MNSNDFGAENTTAASSNPAKQALAVLLHTGKDEQIPTTLSTSYAEPPDNAFLLSATNVGRVSMSMPKTSEKVGEIKREFKKKSNNNKLCSALTLGEGGSRTPETSYAACAAILHASIFPPLPSSPALFYLTT